MSVIQERKSISDRTKVRTRKQPTAGHQTTAIKAQNCFYFKSKSHLLREKKNFKRKNISEHNKEQGGKKNKNNEKPQKHTRHTPNLCHTWTFKTEIERVSVVSCFFESCMTRGHGDRVSPLSSNGGGTLLSRVTAQKENRDILGKVLNLKCSPSFPDIH